jgi:hypothetical protein
MGKYKKYRRVVYSQAELALFEMTATLKRIQDEAVASAILKLDLMGLTPEKDMIECPPPVNYRIHPLRWRAMVRSAFRNGIEYIRVWEVEDK